MSDALERIKKRQRPKVAPRDTSLTSQPSRFPDIQTSRHTDSETYKVSDASNPPPLHPEVETPLEQDIKASRHIDSQSSPVHSAVTTQRHTDIQASRHTDIQTYKSLDDEMQTKRSTFRLEAALIDRLHIFCRQQGLSREVLIEAMYEYMEAHPEAMDQVVAAASEKNEYRQQIANRKRAESMMSKFGGSE